MASHAIYLKVSGKYYPCEPRKAWLRRHLPVMLWVWWFERKLTGTKWGLFVSWNAACPITIHRMKVEQISKDELEGGPIVLDPIELNPYHMWPEWLKTWNAALNIAAQTKGVMGDEWNIEN